MWKEATVSHRSSLSQSCGRQALLLIENGAFVLIYNVQYNSSVDTNTTGWDPRSIHCHLSPGTIVLGHLYSQWAPSLEPRMKTPADHVIWGSCTATPRHFKRPKTATRPETRSGVVTDIGGEFQILFLEISGVFTILFFDVRGFPVPNMEISRCKQKLIVLLGLGYVESDIGKS
jgi:hypothetical protein